MNEFYILSFRKIRRSPAQCCLVEFEDVLLKCCHGKLIATESDIRLSTRNIYIQKIFNNYSISIPVKNTTQSNQILIIVGLSIYDCNILEFLPNWRTRFDLVSAYIFDTYNTPSNISLFSRFTKLINRIDHLFIPMTEVIDDYRNTFTTNIEMIPMAADVLGFGKLKIDRYIDIMAYGRQFLPHKNTLENTYNTRNSPRIFYHTSHFQIGMIHDFYEHRRLFWKLLQNSKIAFAYDGIYTNPERFKCSFIAQRYFECIATGCVIVGKAPSCSEMKEIFGWKDSTLEIPMKENDLIPWLEELLENEDYLQEVQSRNYYNALKFHDWRYRFAQILDFIGLEKPSSLKEELSKLEHKTNNLEIRLKTKGIPI